jgi:hypothetical protein
VELFVGGQLLSGVCLLPWPHVRKGLLLQHDVPFLGARLRDELVCRGKDLKSFFGRCYNDASK